MQVSKRKRTVWFFGSADKPYTSILKKMGRKPCTQALEDKPYMDVSMWRKCSVGDKLYGVVE